MYICLSLSLSFSFFFSLSVCWFRINVSAVWLVTMTRQLAWYHRPAGVLVTPAGVRHEADPSTVGSHACALCALLIPIVHPLGLPLFLSSSQDPLIKFENRRLPAERHRRQCRSVVTRTTPIPCLLAPSYLPFSLLDSFSSMETSILS